MKIWLKSAAAAAALLIAATPAMAAPIVTNFTFTGNFFNGYGVVKGHLTFDTAGVGVMTTGIYIDSSVDYFGNPYIPTFAGSNILPMLQYVRDNAFTVDASGFVTSAMFQAREYFVSPGYQNIFFNLNAFGGYNTYSIVNADYSNESTGNQGGFAGVTYTPAATAVPEPASWALMILGLGVAGYAMRRRRATIRIAHAA